MGPYQQTPKVICDRAIRYILRLNGVCSVLLDISGILACWMGFYPVHIFGFMIWHWDIISDLKKMTPPISMHQSIKCQIYWDRTWTRFSQESVHGKHPTKKTFLKYTIGSMYGIFTYIYHKNQLNVGESTLHGWYGYVDIIGNPLTTQFVVQMISSVQGRAASWSLLKLGAVDFLGGSSFWQETGVYTNT